MAVDFEQFHFSFAGSVSANAWAGGDHGNHLNMAAALDSCLSCHYIQCLSLILASASFD